MKEGKHRFLRRVVILCLIMMSFITLSVALLAWHSGEQLSSATVAALLSAWCTELLLSLLKRKIEKKEEPEEEDTEEKPDYSDMEDEI